MKIIKTSSDNAALDLSADLITEPPKTSSSAQSIAKESAPVASLAASKPELAQFEQTEADTSESKAPPIADILKPKNGKQVSLFAAIWGLISAIFWTILFGIHSSLHYLIRHPIHLLLDIALISILVLVAVTGVEINNQLILDKISDKTVTEIIESSRFSRDFNAEEADRNVGREFLRVGAPLWIQKESIRAILFYARKAGLAIEDQAVLLAIVDIESGFNPFGRAPTTTACGLFQFIRATGEIFHLSPKACMDPWENARAGVEHYIRNFDQKVQLQVTGLNGAERVFRTFELGYYYHHDGIESSNPSNEVKALILSGTQFLFRTYHILQDEMRSQVQATRFSDKFAGNVWKFADRLLDYYHTTRLYQMFSPRDEVAA